MATAVSIASNALVRLGADPINSFDEADAEGSNLDRTRIAANLWPTVRRKVLRSHIWNCAIARVLLSPDAVSPSFGYAYRFQKPSDWLRTIAVGAEEYDRTFWRSEGNYFLSNDSSFSLVYVFDNENPATYDAMLVDALEISMAAAMAYPVTQSTSLAQELADVAARSLMFARGVDSQDDPPDELRGSPLYSSRFGGRWTR